MREDIKKYAIRIKKAGVKHLHRDGEWLQEKSEQLQEQGGEWLKDSADRLKDGAEKFLEDREKKKVWSGADHIPEGKAQGGITPGCLVLEGGSFRGVYTSGVLDVLMENGINLQCTIGTSAGALNGYNYTAGEIGRSAKINLVYRHDGRYFSPVTAAKNHGVVGFQFILDEIEKELPFDHERFDDPVRRFAVTVTNCTNGQVIYCEKGKCSDMSKAVQASASMPLVSEPIEVDGVPCLDGGCSVKIPYRWAMEQGYEKILVVRTRPEYYRREEDSPAFKEAVQRIYKSWSELSDDLCRQAEQYNTACEEMEELQRQGKLMMLCPSGSVSVGTLEGDMEKLGALYLLGRRDTEYMLPQIKAYLGIES